MATGRDRPTAGAHATIVAYLALFVALGGTATALKGTSSVRSDDIARGAVTKSKIARKAVNTLRLAPDSVTTSRLVPGAVTGRILATGAVTSEKIADGTIIDNDIAADAVGAGKIAKDAIGGSELKAGSVGTNKLKDNAVAEAKLADNAVIGEKVKGGSLPLGKLQSQVVTAGEPLAAGLGRPALEFVDALQGAGPIFSIPGFGSFTGACAGDAVTYANDSSSTQAVVVDGGTGNVSATVLAPNQTTAAGSGDGIHVTVFVHDTTTNGSVHAEVFANRSAPVCDFYVWSLSRRP